MPPTSTAQYTITGQTGFDSLTFSSSSPLPELTPTSVLVHLSYASLNYRDLIIPKGLYPFPAKDNVIPGSDGAGTVLAVGKDVTRFKEGDKVLTTFGPLHQSGPVFPQAAAATLGGGVDGVLREYGVFDQWGLVKNPENLSLQ